MPLLIRQTSTVATPSWVKYATAIRDWLEQNRVTVDDIAIVLGISRATATNRWHGRTPWRLDELLAIAELTDRPLSHLALDAEVGELGSLTRFSGHQY